MCYPIRAFLNFLSLDLQAQKLVKGHNLGGYFGCGYCDVEGTWDGTKMSYPLDCADRTVQDYIDATKPLACFQQFLFVTW